MAEKAKSFKKYEFLKCQKLELACPQWAECFDVCWNSTKPAEWESWRKMYGLVKVTIIIKRNWKRIVWISIHTMSYKQVIQGSIVAFTGTWPIPADLHSDLSRWFGEPIQLDRHQHFREILWGWSLSLWQPTLEQKHHYDRKCLHGGHWAAVCIHATLLPLVNSLRYL